MLWMIGPTLVALRGPVADLAPPAGCGGALDLLAIGILRGWPDLQIGQLVGALQFVCVTAALILFAELVYRTTRSVAVAFSSTCALGASGMFPARLALPWAAAAFGAGAIAVIASRGVFSTRSLSWRAAAAGTAALLLSVAVVPVWAVVCAACAFALMWTACRGDTHWRRIVAGTIGAAAVCATAIAVLRVAHGFGMPWTVCAWPTRALAGPEAAHASLLGQIGPVVLALAALGSWLAVSEAGLKRAAQVAAVLVLAILPAASGWRDAVVLAPVVLGIWWLAAVGLRDVFRLMGSGRKATVGIALAAVLWPLLQWRMVAAQESDNIVRALGHQRASLVQIRSLLNMVPDGSDLVEEDASVDLLLRAARSGRRAAKPLAVIPLMRASVLVGLQERRVYVFPSGQRELSLRGFVVEPVADPTGRGGQLRGLGQVTGTRACAELGTDWVDLAGVGASGRVALSAASERAEGPVVVYFGGSTDYEPGPDGWPPRTRRGFGVRIFGRRTAAETARLEAEGVAAGLQDCAVFESPFVARLTLFRTPQSPLALPIVLGPPRPHGVGRLVANYTGALPLTICDAPNHDIIQF